MSLTINDPKIKEDKYVVCSHCGHDTNYLDSERCAGCGTSLRSKGAKREEQKFQFLTTIGKKGRKEKSPVDLVTYLLVEETINYFLKGKDCPIDCALALNQLFIIEVEEQGKKKEISILAYLKTINPTNSNILVKESELKIEGLCQNYLINFKDNESITLATKLIAEKMKGWYSVNGTVTLKNNWKKLRGKIFDKFKRSLLGLDRGSLEASQNFLLELARYYEMIEKEYRQQAKECLDKEEECQKIYQNNLRKKKEIIKITLKNLYKFKIEKEVYSLAAQIIKDILIDLQGYVREIESSRNFLRKIQENSQVKADFSPVLIFYPKNSKFLDLEMIKQNIETKLAKKSLKWGNEREISEQMVEEALTEELRPYAELSCAYWRDLLNH